MEIKKTIMDWTYNSIGWCNNPNFIDFTERMAINELNDFIIFYASDICFAALEPYLRAWHIILALVLKW
jgi:hypothetical protein